jgi:hypothetical protein
VSKQGVISLPYIARNLFRDGRRHIPAARRRDKSASSAVRPPVHFSIMNRGARSGSAPAGRGPTGSGAGKPPAGSASRVTGPCVSVMTRPNRGTSFQYPSNFDRAHLTCPSGRLWVAYLTGIMRCSYGDPGHITYGLLGSGSAVRGYPFIVLAAAPTIMT